ncbi:MAG: type II toxin-antitoxin system MqsA family antitoxin [Pseudomonadota bacterium]
MSKLGKELIDSMGEAVAWAKGEIELNVREYNPPEKVEVAEIRKNLGLTQSKFASMFGLKVGALRDWEQDRRKPEGAARTLLAIIALHPEIVQEVLVSSEFKN